MLIFIHQSLALESKVLISLKPVFHLATLFARREAKTRIWHRDWLKLAGEKICREQVGTVPTFLFVRANKVAKWKTGFTLLLIAESYKHAELGMTLVLFLVRRI